MRTEKQPIQSSDPNKKFKLETRRVDTFMLILLLGHIPLGAFVVPYGYGTMFIGLTGSCVISFLALAGFLFLRGTVYLRILNAILLMSYSALFVACEFGRIEMHFHFFSAMAFLVLYRDWRTLPAVVLYVGGHHGIANYCQSIGAQIAGLPFKVFSTGTGWDLVILHALFVVFEVSVLWYICVVLRAQFFSQETLIQKMEILQQKERSNTVSDVTETSANLTRVARSVAETSGLIAQSTQSQAASIEEMSASTEQLTGAMDNIFETTSRQSKTVLGLISQMEDLEKTVTLVSERIAMAVATAEKTSTVARGGEASLVEMSASMQRIADNAQMIEDVVDLIDDIADRVNLLSLNASIEAARAGEAGRGFAVVAQEISRLADQTAKSTKDISTLVQTSTSSIQDGQTKMDHHIRLLNTIVKDVDSMNSITSMVKESTDGQLQAFEHFALQLMDVNSVALMIKDSIAEQRGAMREVTDAVTEVNSVTQSYALMADKLALAATENEGLASQLRSRFQEFADGS